eukprot:1189949-Prorocentrum_minimum.AAC.6
MGTYEGHLDERPLVLKALQRLAPLLLVRGNLVRQRFLVAYRYSPLLLRVHYAFRDPEDVPPLSACLSILPQDSPALLQSGERQPQRNHRYH